MNGDTTPQAPPQPESPWQYDGNQPPQARQQLPPLPGQDEVTWTASEFIDHGKDSQWYLMLASGTIVADVILYFWIHEFFTIAAITIMAVLLGIMAGRKPQVLTYKLDSGGITIADKYYPYGAFRSFSIIDEGAFSSVMLMPLKRFMVP